MKLNILTLLVVVSFLTSVTSVSQTRALESANGKVILEVTGAIGVTNTEDGRAVFDHTLLQQFKSVMISTTTPWTNGVVQFEGILLKDLMDALQAKGSSLQATAANEYSVIIPFEDFQNYNVILAYKKNNKLMTLRDKGPFWVIYPWDTNPELLNEVYHSRSIWQLKSIKVQ